jgi:iron complex transport system substrate-binding protein
VVTSTTHIPALDALGVLDKLVGFPNTQYISSVAARKLINNGSIQELGKNESLNFEMLIDLSPDVVVGFGIDGTNKALNNIKKSGIPVLYNSEWLEQHALGRAEWIKFFGFLFKKEAVANKIFNKIKEDYFQAKNLAAKATNTPSVLSGMPYKDTWYLPYANSWAAQFFEDANAAYLWSDKKGKGSLTLNFESVLERAKNADFWIAVADYTNKQQLLNSNAHYEQFKMFNDNSVYLSNKKGETGGLLFYELAPSRPDLILKDLIKIFHPELLPNHTLIFYDQLN